VENRKTGKKLTGEKDYDIIRYVTIPVKKTAEPGNHELKNRKLK